MSMLIKGNPKEGTYQLIKTTDGWVLEGMDIAYCGFEIHTPHGRLIDEDEIYEQPHCGECNDATIDAINNAPTILEAEE